MSHKSWVSAQIHAALPVLINELLSPAFPSLLRPLTNTVIPIPKASQQTYRNLPPTLLEHSQLSATSSKMSFSVTTVSTIISSSTSHNKTPVVSRRERPSELSDEATTNWIVELTLLHNSSDNTLTFSTPLPTKHPNIPPLNGYPSQ